MYNLDEITGEYAVISVQVTIIETDPDGMLTAVDTEGNARYVLEDGEWKEVVQGVQTFADNF